MVTDVKHIEQLLRTHFRFWGDYTIDPVSGKVHVAGMVILTISPLIKKLPVQFGHVAGSFHCTDNTLNTLEGSPDHVDEWFEVDYTPTMPLLRTLVAQKGVGLNGKNVPLKLDSIINNPDYRGRGKAAALKVTGELIRAGFKENARW